jgi:hypothetical protein
VKERALVAPRKKRRFVTVREAREALANDKLGTVYRRATDYFVVTASGSGVFPRKDWEAGSGA